MAILRGQVVLPFLSGLPEDVSVNTFHFDAADASQANKDNVAALLGTFYTVTPPPGPSTNALQPLGAFFSNAVSRATNACTIKVYNLADTKPRPVTAYPFTLPTSSSPSGKEIPAEVACVGSFYGLRNIPRQRGRIYFGPFHEACMEDDATNQRSRPTLALRETIWSCCQRMASTLGTANWAVYSPTSNLAHVVTDGWVDDAWDTQRRRGQDAAGRLIWS